MIFSHSILPCCHDPQQRQMIAAWEEGCMAKTAHLQSRQDSI